MDNHQDDAARARFYQSHRERHQTAFKAKHKAQYDREFRDLTGARADMSVLEIGCGTGIFLRYLEAAGHAEIVGVDSDPGLADALADLTRAEVHLSDARAALAGPLAGRRFDRIVMLDVAEHLHLAELTDLLKTLRAMTVPGGKLLLRVPNVESPWGLRMFYGTFDHVTPLGPGRMEELAGMTGWRFEGCHPQVPGRALRRLKENIANGILARLLSYHPTIWTANVLAVYGADGAAEA